MLRAERRAPHKATSGVPNIHPTRRRRDRRVGLYALQKSQFRFGILKARIPDPPHIGRISASRDTCFFPHRAGHTIPALMIANTESTGIMAAVNDVSGCIASAKRDNEFPLFD